MTPTGTTNKTSTTTTFINLSGYAFFEIPEEKLELLRALVKQICQKLCVKGTILLAPEGINYFVAATQENTTQLLIELRTLFEQPNLKAKESISDRQPFRRMLIKIKKEIIAFGVEGIHPAKKGTAKLPPRELKEWLDAGKKVTLFDTRNDYEIKMGTFKGAIPAGTRHFRDFPKAVEKLPEELKKEPIVMFCTGGIRCEKAGPYMEREGFEQVYQLEGGILDYFKECQEAHYEGECFVFDQRVGVDPQLQESKAVLCFACQMPLTPEEQKDPRYVIEKSCPYCFNRPPKPPKPIKPRRKRREALEKKR